ncbi:MAG: UDP-N-acetylglucosamine 1-carboxyvinyltransferase [Candidatus Sumerlaeia bacterium]
MSVLHIQGGRPLSGEAPASGAKNAVLPLMAAALLSDEPTTLLNVPRLRDVETMCELLASLGVRTSFAGGRLHINPAGFEGRPVTHDLMSRMRASYYVIPALLARRGQAKVGMPGGCAIGARKIDLHLRAFAALGAEIREDEDAHEITLRLRSAGGLTGAGMTLIGERGTSVGATCNALMAAVLAGGDTTLEGAAQEPEVACLVEMLRSMGAVILGEGSPTLHIRGVRRLHGTEFTVIPDRIEAGTYLLAGAITRGCVTITHCRPDHMGAALEALGQMGVELRISQSAVTIVRVPPALKPLNITTRPYPGFPTDLQSPFVALLTQAEGLSVVRETIFENRFQTGLELRDKMGANVSVDDEPALIVQGPTRLRPAVLEAGNLRQGAALVLAALAADGESEVHNVHFIQRGYERLAEKLSALGASITLKDPVLQPE